VGSGDFTLGVFGSLFNGSSTVLWNQATRTTTFVSSTQLTAAIAAADVSAIGSATVTVSNAAVLAPLVSNGVTFNIIPDISSIISQLQNIAANPAVLLTELSTWVTLEQSQVDALNTQVATDNTSIGNLDSQVQNLNVTVNQQANTISQLQAALTAAKGATASPLDVAQSFKSVVDQIQQQARAAGGVQTTLTNMNVQLKTLISVQPQSGTTPPQAVLGFPDLTAPPDPNLLSTMTLAFGAIPNLQPPVSPGPGVSSSSSSAPAPSVPSSDPVTAPASSGSSAASKPASSAPLGRAGTGARADRHPRSRKKGR
jgi:hypothetical protein